MISTIQAFPTTDGIFVVWEVAAMIPDCLGFALYRQQQGKSATVGGTALFANEFFVLECAYAVTGGGRGDPQLASYG